MIDIQTQKLRFMEEYIRLTDATIIEKLTQLLREEKQKIMQAKLKPMTAEQLTDKLDRSENDIKEGRLHTQEEVENYFKSKRST
jgi:predicted transcriptional regulator